MIHAKSLLFGFIAALSLNSFAHADLARRYQNQQQPLIEPVSKIAGCAHYVDECIDAIRALKIDVKSIKEVKVEARLCVFTSVYIDNGSANVLRHVIWTPCE